MYPKAGVPASASSKQFRRLLTCSASLAAMMAGPFAALAQDGPTADSGGIAEIIVTAQKREQSLQDVPVAVTALNQDVLKVNRVTNTMDLNGLAPGLATRQNAGSTGSPSYTMRGVFASASVPSQDRQISSYVDGVYIGGSRGAVFDLPDLDRIEVLRGPQGTLFGRNATAGAVSIVTRDPSGEMNFRQEITIGNYDQLKSRTTIDTPQFGMFSAYVTYVHDERRGDTRNLGAGTVFDRTSPFSPNVGRTTSPKWLGSKNAENIFAALKIDPGADFTLTYKFDRSQTDNTPEARVSTVINALDPTGFGGFLAGALALQTPGGGSFGLVTTNPDNKRPKAVNNAWTMPGYVNTYGHNVTMNWQATDNLSFKNITAYRQARSLGISTIMGLSGLEVTPALAAAFQFPDFLVGAYLAGYEGNNYGRYWQVSNELQANYDSDLLTLTVGGLYYHSKEVSGGVPGMAPNFAASPLFEQIPLGNVQINQTKTTSIAAYAQAEFHVTPQLDLVAGARITRDKKDNLITLGGTYTGTDRTNGTISGTTVSSKPFKKTKPTFSLGANYKVNNDVLVYGKFSTAFLSGGATGPLSFEPETVKSWEAGLKSDWFDRRLRFNLALFHATYKHSQSAQSGQNVFIDGQNLAAYGVVVIDNGTTKAKGVEAEIVVAPIDGLSLGGSLGYTDVSWKNPNPFLTQGRDVVPSSLPKVVGAVNAQYITPPVAGDATVLFRIDGIYQDKFRSTPFTDIATVGTIFEPYIYNPSRWIFNGRVALRDIEVGGANLELGLWARNMFDNKDAVYPLLFGSSQHNASYQPARTWGVDVVFNFGS